ncbi:uncharacterized protein LOC130590777 [Beta vulgaris subsp. vulgaris]|uniref:uncharacterized protein LOC130590777 n=1 Tax=Beta vulgaris subsp. vulgaris TaxID=3555 RepID=UPI0025469D11|nr:uncharacterized protein LOC130590777 [Beta vulgaris subsp. vulgaris]
MEAYGKACNMERILKREEEVLGRIKRKDQSGNSQTQGYEKKARYGGNNSGVTIREVVIPTITVLTTQSRSKDEGDNNKKVFVCKKCNKSHPGFTCQGERIECFQCGESGHKANQCPNRQLTKIRETTTMRIPIKTNTRPIIALPILKFQTPMSFVEKFSLEPSSSCLANIVMSTGTTIPCNTLFQDIPITISGTDLPADLILFSLKDFDVILGMDWLSRYKAKIECHKQKVSLKGLKGNRISYQGVVFTPGIKIISALNLQTYIRKGYTVYLCHMKDISKEDEEIPNIPVVCEFPDVFPEEFQESTRERS